MGELTNKMTSGEIQTIPSYEVAKMMERRHSRVLEMIEGKANLKGIKKVLTQHNFVLSDYFIESTYKDESGKENKCYECTKMGCEMLANKMTGEKGILFTAKYVKRFNEMEKQLQQLLLEQLQQEVKVLTNYKIKGDTINDVCSATGLRRKTIKEYLFDHEWVEEYNGEISNYDGRYIYVMRRKDVHFTKKGLDKILKDLQPRKPKRVFFNKELYKK